MKIYSVKDVLLEYYEQPFVAQSDKQVLAALAVTINSREQTNAIKSAPHHFQIWSLGEIEEDTGRITPKLEFIAECSSLIRAGVRERETNEPGTGANGSTPSSGMGSPERTGGARAP